MSQHDFDITNTDANTGITVRAQLNAALKALASNSSGNAEPTTMYAFQPWVDTSATPAVYKIRNSSNTAWITVGTLDSAGNLFKLVAADLLATLLTVDGAGSGLDADKLDGQEGSYYLPASSYTAADVLTKLLTVDGAGSGIDADRLEGKRWVELVNSSVSVSSTNTAWINLKPSQQHNLYLASVYCNNVNIADVVEGYSSTSAYFTIQRTAPNYANDFLQIRSYAATPYTFYYKVMVWE